MNAVPPACLPLAQRLHSEMPPAMQDSRPPAAHQTLSEELLSRQLVSGSTNARDVLPQVQEFALGFFCLIVYLVVFFPLTILRFCSTVGCSFAFPGEISHSCSTLQSAKSSDMTQCLPNPTRGRWCLGSLHSPPAQLTSCSTLHMRRQ